MKKLDILAWGTSIALALALTGCDISQKARDAIAADFGFITTAQAQNKAACVAQPTLAKCVLINRGIALHNTAIDALNVYCAGPAKAGEQAYDQGGPCSPQKGLQPRLQSALGDLNKIIPDIKALIH